MSVCQYVRMQLFSLVIKMKVVQNVINKDGKTASMKMSRSRCQDVRMQLFSLGIKMKVQKVIMMSDSQKTSTDS